MSAPETDFSKYSHAQLRQMVEGLNSGDVMSASDPWRRAASTLKQIRTALNTASGDATQKWEGASSDAFYGAMTKLATNVNNISAYANDAANTLQMMSEAIDQAKHDMPEEPGLLDQLGNAISDTFQNAIGQQDDSTQIPIADQRKNQAVAVMQTLANKYRVATPVLKPPNVPSLEDPKVPPPDPNAAAALSAFVTGAGVGAVGGYSTAPTTTRATTHAATTTAPPAPSPRKSDQSAPADSGIAGGVPNAPTRAPKSVAVGADAPSVAPAATSVAAPTQPAGPVIGTGIDHTALSVRPSLAGTGASPIGGTGSPSAGLPFGPGAVAGRTSTGGGGFDAPWPKAQPGTGTPIRGGAGAAPGEEGGGPVSGRAGGNAAAEASGAGRGLAGSSGERVGGGVRANTPRRTAGAIGEEEAPSASPRVGPGKEAFTEGGSGLGARTRAADSTAAEEQEAGMGLVPGGSQSPERKKKRKGQRADYLVEDEETWASDQDANPDVVE
ncbi:PPE domain-containing protein [Kitasatospora viridis]|uniref:PPE-repeat protein n=1 Tax=Kitasatospora viridis TaxID=281105 RepID=A0A561UKC6_9ACTN|nr:PPE domain-containing protein [Kitasatospora viridis]TWF99785.1 PPE-repeat protein [Kitasatospora viridis]